MYQKDYIKIISVFSFLVAYFSLVYFSVDQMISLDDHFFHIRFAQIIKDQGIDAFKNFHWIYFSKISINQTYFIYYNFLFYLVLIPFTFIKPLFLGIKLYAVIFASVYFSLLYYFFLKIKEKSAFLWIVVFLAIMSPGHIWRFLLSRPYALAPILLVIELYLLHKKKYIGVFILSFLYLFWHSATFFFPMAVAVIYFMFDAFYNENKLNWKIIISSFLGVGLSIVIMNLFTPGFYYYMKDVILGIYTDTILGKKVNINEGGEAYGVDFIDFIKTNIPIITLFIIAVVFEVYRYIEEKRKEDIEIDEIEWKKRPLKSSLFFLSIGFFLGTFLSRRNGDFFVFFSAAYLAMSYNYFIEHIEIKNPVIKKSLFAGIIVTIIFLFVSNLLILRSQIIASSPYDTVEGAALWLKNNTQKGDVVFNASWNWFPTLFYYNSNNYYIAGIEPRFLYDYNHEMYWVWWSISNKGYACPEEKCDQLEYEKQHSSGNNEKKNAWNKKEGDLVAKIIKDNFKSRYIITAKENSNLNNLMDNNDNFKKVFTDNIYNQFFIYEIR